MPKSQLLKLEGTVTEALPNGEFMVSLPNPETRVPMSIRCHTNGKMRLHHIKVLAGDAVLVDIVPGIPAANQVGRITYRKA